MLANILTKKLIFLVFAVLSFSIHAENIEVNAQVTLGKKEILLDNDKVEVVRLVYPPNSESGMHSHEFASRTIYVVEGGELALISENSASKKVTLTAGQVLYMPSSTHNIKNIGNTKVVIIETELK